MTTSLQAIAGPSKYTTAMQPKIEPVSPLNSIDNEVSVTKPGLTVGENGEVVKVPAFLNKLYRCVLLIAAKQLNHTLKIINELVTDNNSMVSDPDTEELIYWAESGDSFFGE
jgi:heat shock transcription factor